MYFLAKVSHKIYWFLENKAGKIENYADDKFAWWQDGYDEWLEKSEHERLEKEKEEQKRIASMRMSTLSTIFKKMSDCELEFFAQHFLDKLEYYPSILGIVENRAMHIIRYASNAKVKLSINSRKKEDLFAQFLLLHVIRYAMESEENNAKISQLTHTLDGDEIDTDLLKAYDYEIKRRCAYKMGKELPLHAKAAVKRTKI